MAEEWYETDQGQRPPPGEYELRKDRPEDATPSQVNPPSTAPHDVPRAVPRADGTSWQARVSDIAASLAHNSGVAFQLLRKWLERYQLSGLVLPEAFRALGKHVYDEGAYRADFPNSYVRLDGLLAEIALLQNQPPIEQQATTFMVRAQAAARAARHPLSLMVLTGRRTHALRELGKAAFKKSGERSATGNAAFPVVDALARIEKLNVEIAELSRSQPGQIITPNRILIVGGVVCLLLLLLLIGWLFF